MEKYIVLIISFLCLTTGLYEAQTSTTATLPADTCLIYVVSESSDGRNSDVYAHSPLVSSVDVNRHRIVISDTYIHHIDVSPYTNLLATVESVTPNGLREIHIYRRGTKISTVTPEAGWYFHPTWRPDGTEIAVIRATVDPFVSNQTEANSSFYIDRYDVSNPFRPELLREIPIDGDNVSYLRASTRIPAIFSYTRKLDGKVTVQTATWSMTDVSDFPDNFPLEDTGSGFYLLYETGVEWIGTGIESVKSSFNVGIKIGQNSPIFNARHPAVSPDARFVTYVVNGSQLRYQAIESRNEDSELVVNMTGQFISSVRWVNNNGICDQ